MDRWVSNLCVFSLPTSRRAWSAPLPLAQRGYLYLPSIEFVFFFPVSERGVVGNRNRASHLRKSPRYDAALAAFVYTHSPPLTFGRFESGLLPRGEEQAEVVVVAAAAFSESLAFVGRR